MVTEGRVISRKLKNSTFYVNWQLVEQRDNTSIINWQAGLNVGSSPYDEWYLNAVKIHSVEINGSTVVYNKTYSYVGSSSSRGDNQLEAGSISIPHNGDGTKVFKIKISGWLYRYGNTSGETYFELPIILRSPSNQKINGVFEALVPERTSPLKLTWDSVSNDPNVVKGYKIYWARGYGWQLLGTVGTGTTSYTTSISNFYNNMARGEVIGFQITAFNDNYESGKAYAYDDNNGVQLALMSANVSYQNVTATQVKVNWTSNIATQRLEWKVINSNNWKVASSGLNNTSGTFNITGLAPNTSYRIQIRLTAKSDNTQIIREISFKTLDIARLTKYPTSWEVGDEVSVTISNPANCTLQLYISYNNIEVISRTNIKPVNGIYKFSLTDAEQTLLYTQVASNPNPNIKFVLKSFLPNKIGEDIKQTKITFPMYVWTKINNIWKRAMMWVKVGNTWKKCQLWVKVNNTWKRV